MVSLRSKIQGALIGGAIGDAWGMSVEGWTPERIETTHPGGVHQYVPPIGHKWFNPEEQPPGTTTDDTQFHVATLMGLMAGKTKADQSQSFDDYMNAIAQAHVDSLANCSVGSAPTTKEAIARIAAGESWRTSGKTDVKGRGTGNGIPMKIGALSTWYATPVGQSFGGKQFSFNQACIDYASMTHYTKMSALAGMVHGQSVLYCFQSQPHQFQTTTFLDIANDLCWAWSEEILAGGYGKGRSTVYSLEHLADTEDKLSTVFGLLSNTPLLHTSRDEIRKLFGNGGCYVYHSLPFTYAFFLWNPQSMQSLDDLINAGGDTDTNGKMLGEMLGALHGIELFEQPENRWTVEGLREYESLLTLANRFCDLFGVE